MKAVRTALSASAVLLALAAAPVRAESCDLYTSARADALDIFVTVYRIEVGTAGACYPATRRAEPPLTCVVDGQHFGTAVAPPALAGAGVANPTESNDFCEAHGRLAISLEDCTLWSVNGRFFRAGNQVGAALAEPEIACAP